MKENVHNYRTNLSSFAERAHIIATADWRFGFQNAFDS